MTQSDGQGQITEEELRERARVLGVVIPEGGWTQILPMVQRAIEPLRAFDEAELKLLEPAVVFRANRPGG